MFDTILHKWIHIPYKLHVQYHQRPKSYRRTIVFLHGIGNSSESWREVIDRSPSDVRVITIDLLGFGQSPRPSWARYDAQTQARAVIRTLLSIRTVREVTLVGHSLGSLVAVQVAKQYPAVVRDLVLCSPPLYAEPAPHKRLPNIDSMLRDIYRATIKRPDQFVTMAQFAIKYKLVNRSFNVTRENVDIYFAALEAMIINQSSYDDLQKLSVPIVIMKGTFDPFVVGKNLAQLAKSHDAISLVKVPAGHEITGRFIPAVASVLRMDDVTALPKAKKRAKIKT